jgi:hypothetical protein
MLDVIMQSVTFSYCDAECDYAECIGANIDCLSLFMCPLLAQRKIGFFSLFFAAAVYSTNEENTCC